MTQAGLKKAVTSILKSKYKEVIETEDYVVAKGSIPIALVAHLDTVFKSPPRDIYYDRQKGVLISPEGLGADDRAGVYAILKIISSGLRPHIIFTTDEELGCVGAAALAQVDCPFDYIKFVIELDRRGTNDCVFYDCDNEEFVKYISSFGFTEAWGTFSDICEICPAWEVAGVNLSVGYKNEHSYGETLWIEPLLDTIEKVKKILADTDAKQFKYIPTTYLSQYYGWNFGGIGKSSWYRHGSKTMVCHKCSYEGQEEEMFPVKMLDGSVKNYCSDCILEDVEWCYICGKPHQIPKNYKLTKEGFICKECKDKHEV